MTKPSEVAARLSTADSIRLNGGQPDMGGVREAMIELVMWDLDETMLPTRHLRDVRHRSEPCALEQVSTFTGTALHDGVSDAVIGISGVRTGLVTSSPRWYVEQILESLLPDVEFDVLVTYEDVHAIKPDPEPILLALQDVGSDPGRSVYIGDDLADHQACTAANVRFLGAGWADAPTFPSSAEVLAHPRDILTILESR